jgi:hypothetical protein
VRAGIVETRARDANMGKAVNVENILNMGEGERREGAKARRKTQEEERALSCRSLYEPWM